MRRPDYRVVRPSAKGKHGLRNAIVEHCLRWHGAIDYDELRGSGRPGDVVDGAGSDLHFFLYMFEYLILDMLVPAS